ncbi:coiled-coil domain-containing protein 62 isoform X2 [Hyla sarda]|uniref:coiled-coil domain-containing protein 62 isoform X2 n=1 Tax=Hyla sarda TaxID=327740 RepID=UPI0024C27A9A|nr:coiled-coil domain-containing protein 62 isoform X2 [Hyla sarda]
MNSSDSSSKFVCTDLENSTIQKQRKELQLLIAELKDRDKELNDMVFVHQRQLLAWENDRQHVLRLEQKCARLENELQRRNGIIRSITNRIKSLEAQQQDRKTTLANTQQQLQEVCLKASEANNHCQDLEEKNQSLNGSVLELSAQVGRLKAREQELSTLLRLKDKDIIAATNHIAEFTSRFKDLEAALRDSRLRETSAMKEMQGLKPRINGLKTELDKLKDDVSQKTVENNEQREEIIRLKQESAYLQAELVFAAEREKRKDQLLQLAKSKQDRTDRELQNLRQIYMKQQHDLQFLQLTSESSGDKAQKRLDVSCCPSGVKLYSGENDELATNYESPPLCMEDLNMPLMQSTLKDSETLRCQHLYSPTNKLQDLLAKSRQMVTDLELGSLFSDPWGNSSKMHITENFLYTDPPGTESREDKWANLDGL